MRCLSLTQPWASLVAIGAKRIETRSWRTSYRGPLAIHAAKGFPAHAQTLVGDEPFLSALWPLRRPGSAVLSSADLPRGAVIAVCQLAGCVPTEADDFTSRRWWREEERPLGDYAPGRYAWVLLDIEALPEPIPARGSLGLWRWTPPAGFPYATERTCRVCGCTDERACSAGCWWVEADLCSECRQPALAGVRG